MKRERPRVPVRVQAALLAVLAAIGFPRAPETPAPHVWDVLVVLVERTVVEVPGIRGPRIIRAELTDDDRQRVRDEILAFVRRVEDGTGGRLEVRPRIVSVPGPLTTLTGPGPFWIGPRDLAPLIADRVEIGDADTVMAFAKIGEDEGPAAPVRHLGGALGGDDGLEGACFAGIGFRPKWIDGSGTVALHEWLHGLRWALTEVGGFPEASLADPDEGRRGPTCCADAPEGDGPFADHLLGHLTEEMIRAADARAGPTIDDRYLRGWAVDGVLRPGAWRTITLRREDRSAVAHLSADCPAVVVESDGPVTVETIPGRRVTVTRAAEGVEIRFSVRAAQQVEAP